MAADFPAVFGWASRGHCGWKDGGEEFRLRFCASQLAATAKACFVLGHRVLTQDRCALMPLTSATGKIN